MPLFATPDDCYAVMVPFLSELITDPEVRPKFVAGNTSFKVHYTDPDVLLMLDCTQDPPTLQTGADAERAVAEVSLTMSADDGHKFWLGDMNMAMAVARRKVKVNGPVGKLLGLLPALQPAFVRYQGVARAQGLPAKP